MKYSDDIILMLASPKIKILQMILWEVFWYWMLPLRVKINPFRSQSRSLLLQSFARLQR